jgi:hypothetical protein
MDTRLCAVIEGKVEGCSVCKGEIGDLTSCEACDRTGYYVPAPSGKPLRVEVVEIRKGTKRDGIVVIDDEVDRYEPVKWEPCCETLRRYVLATLRAKFSHDLGRSTLVVQPTVDRETDLLNPTMHYPTVRLEGVILHYCPGCGRKVKVVIVSAKANVGVWVRRTEYVLTDDIEVELR